MLRNTLVFIAMVSLIAILDLINPVSIRGLLWN